MRLYSGYHALIIGNSEYRHFPKLRGVKGDVQDVKAMLEKLNVQVTLLENQTGAQMQKAMSDFVDVTGKDPERGLIFYFAGHGYTEKRADGTDLGYIVAIDAPAYEINKGDFRSKAISMSQINEYAELVQSKHVLMIFDSCFSGTIFTARRAIPKIIDVKTSQPTRQFITAGAADETVPDQSIFKTTLLKGLGEGFADLNRDYYVTGAELGVYLEDNVVEYSRGNQHPKFGTIPNPKLDRGDFVFALHKPVEEKKATVSTPITPTQKPPPAQSETELERMTGDLRITVDFETEVFVDRVSKGKAKLGYAMNVKALTVGAHTVEMFFGNAKLSDTVQILENETVRLDWKQSSIQSRISSTPRFTLNSNPQGANFTIDGYPSLILQTPFAFYDPISTKYRVSFSRKRYQDTSAEIITTSGARGESTVQLIPQFGDLKLSSEPTRSAVWLNDQEMGETPLDLSGEVSGLSPGTYTLKVVPKSPNYAHGEKVITIKPNVTMKEHIILKDILALLTIRSDHYPFLLLSNGEQIAVVAKESTLRVAPGILKLEIKPKGASATPLKTVSTTLSLAPNEERLLQVRMILAPAEIVISSSPDDAKFVLSDAGGKRTPLNGNHGIADAGLYTLTAGKWGFYTQQSQITLKENERYNAKIVFQPIPRAILKQQSKWKFHRYGALSTLAAGIGIAAYMYHQADLDYEDYQAASNPSTALECREIYLDSRRNYHISLNFNILPFAWLAYSTFKGSMASNRIQTEMRSRISQ
ncbi:MAG: caspase family protein [Candidatus Cloacimonadaceae bacterium]|nr:caspase family protein [Candidatus Cloacimonadaceae bacterium]MDP3113211.1 caspase family protein [Candidatus Cloacimonadaceae bacterium]